MITDLLFCPVRMAPEIMQQVDYDGKADIWSLGISCLEMANGAPPHFGIHPLGVMKLITSQPPPTLDGDQFSKSFKEFVAMCLVKAPEFRPSVSTLLRHSWIKKAGKLNAIRQMFPTAATNKK